MLPTLLVGDYLFVDKNVYGFSRHSLPFGPPLFEGRIFESPVERGDVVVFKLPRDNSTDYIKRIIGIPGDRIQMRKGVLHINGKAVPKVAVEKFSHPDGRGNIFQMPQFRETLPNGVSHKTLDLYVGSDLDSTRIFTVPEGYYFAMGDNRDNSVDSRVAGSAGGVGLIPAENLVGRAEMLFFSTNGKAAWWEIWNWPWAIRYERLFTAIE
jgi:signal peptidase I